MTIIFLGPGSSSIVHHWQRLGLPSPMIPFETFVTAAGLVSSTFKRNALHSLHNFQAVWVVLRAKYGLDHRFTQNMYGATLQTLKNQMMEMRSDPVESARFMQLEVALLRSTVFQAADI
jgi:hypothetical protein